MKGVVPFSRLDTLDCVMPSTSATWRWGTPRSAIRRFRFRATMPAESAALLGAGNVVTVMDVIVFAYRIQHNVRDWTMRTATE